MTASGTFPPDPDRNLALELVRVTEAAAIAAGRYMGRGDKERVDQAAVDAMRPVLNSVQMDGIVVIGEGEKDEAPMLYNGEHVGAGTPPEVDFAVDPVDGTTLTAKSLPDAISVVAVAERGTMFDPGPCVYMEKLAVAEDVADVVDLDAPIADNLRRIAERRASALRTSRWRCSIVRATRISCGRCWPPERASSSARRRRRGSNPGGRPFVVGGPLCRDRRDARGRDRGLRAAVPGRSAPRAPVTRATTASGRRRWSAAMTLTA